VLTIQEIEENITTFKDLTSG